MLRVGENYNESRYGTDAASYLQDLGFYHMNIKVRLAAKNMVQLCVFNQGTFSVATR